MAYPFCFGGYSVFNCRGKQCVRFLCRRDSACGAFSGAPRRSPTGFVELAPKVATFALSVGYADTITPKEEFLPK